MTIARHVKHASLALIALSCVGVLQGAYANGTASGTNITNQATVDYSVGGVTQTTITSPAASFVVDTRIDFNVTELGGTATQTTPGLVNVVTRFQLTNTGNSTQGYVLSVVNEAGTVVFTQTDNQDVNNVRIFSHLANIGDTRSLIIHPASTTHRQLTDEERVKAGAGPEVVRLSIGIEDTKDLIADLDQAMAA